MIIIFNVEDIFLIINASATIALVIFAWNEWIHKRPKIKTFLFPPIVGNRIKDKKSYIFYLACTNYGNLATSIYRIQLFFTYKDNTKKQLDCIPYNKKGIKFLTPSKEEIDIKYEENKFPINEILQQGKSIKGFLIFEATEEDQDIEELKEAEIVLEDMFGKRHSSIISSDKLNGNTENLRTLMIHSNIIIPSSALKSN